MGNIIYSKKYPDPAPCDSEPTAEPDAPVPLGRRAGHDQAGGRVPGLTFMEIPGRSEGAQPFIDAVKELCDACWYDVEISELPFGIMAELSMDSDSYSDGRLNRLIGMAHDISLLSCINERDVTVRLYYVTMNIFRDGERFYPQLSHE